MLKAFKSVLQGNSAADSPFFALILNLGFNFGVFLPLEFLYPLLITFGAVAWIFRIETPVVFKDVYAVSIFFAAITADCFLLVILPSLLVIQ